MFSNFASENFCGINFDFLDEFIESDYSTVPDSVLEIESGEIKILKVNWEFNWSIELTL